MARKKDMTKEERAFVREYLKNGKNATQAYIDAKLGGEANMTTTRANYRPRAAQYLKHAHVKRAIDKAESQAMGKVREAMAKYAITKERIAEELAKIAFSDTRDVMTWGPDGVQIKPSSEISDEAAAAVSEVSETKSEKTGRTVKLKNYDKVSALVNLGKSLGMFAEKVDHQHKHVSVNFVIDKD